MIAHPWLYKSVTYFDDNLREEFAFFALRCNQIPRDYFPRCMYLSNIVDSFWNVLNSFQTPFCKLESILMFENCCNKCHHFLAARNIGTYFVHHSYDKMLSVRLLKKMLHNCFDILGIELKSSSVFLTTGIHVQ